MEKRFSRILENIQKKIICSGYVANVILFGNKPIIKKRSNFVEKTLFFAFIKMGMCLRVYNNMQNLWSTAGFEPTTSGFPTAVKPDTCVYYQVAGVVDCYVYNCRILSVTLKVDICSVRCLSLPIWWRYQNLIQSAVLLCCVILAKHETVP